ncbi:MAG: hypothetical protein O2951_18715 [Bacteroidetes bacterium]|nr:hypothetical protein [Bacteroidota bacterium]
MSENDRYPFDFNLTDIKNAVQLYGSKGKFKKALKMLEIIEEKWVLSRDQIDFNRDSRFKHLADYNIASIFNTTENPTKVNDEFLLRLYDMMVELREEADEILEKEKINSPYSGLEWATIFYYAHQTKLLPESNTLKEYMEQFMEKHSIQTTFKYFRSKYYDSKKRIYQKGDYPINKLKKIIPFLRDNYHQTVTKVENEITFLQTEKPDY